MAEYTITIKTSADGATATPGRVITSKQLGISFPATKAASTKAGGNGGPTGGNGGPTGGNGGPTGGSGSGRTIVIGPIVIGG